MIVGILFILMTTGCQAPAGSQGSVALEQAFVELPAGEEREAGEAVADPPAARDFGDLGEVEDPFATIGPAFSGLGFEGYSSNCDPFEDAYGTCL